jgi:hypothetical protein
MKYLDSWQDKVKSLHDSEFRFWVLAKFMGGLGIGMLLPVYVPNPAWAIAGWMLIAFAVILGLPAISAVASKRKR